MVFSGTVHLIGSLMARGQDDLWWTTLVIAIIEFLLAFWAIGYPGRSIRLLIVWVAAWALARGLGQIVAGFELRSSRRRPAVA